MCYLVMSPFSCDYMKSFYLFTCIQHSQSAWFLDGRASILVIIVLIDFGYTFTTSFPSIILECLD